MASGYSTAYSNTMLDHIYRAQTAPTFPATLYVAAFNASNAASFLASNNIASASEVSNSGTAYGRIQIMNGTSILFTAASAGQTTTDSDITWSAATASWGTVYAIALMDSATVGAGNVLAYGDLNTPRAISIPDVLRIPAGQLIIGF